MTYSIILQFERSLALALQSTTLIYPSGQLRQAETQSGGIQHTSNTFSWCPSVKIAAFLLTLAAGRSRLNLAHHPLIVTYTSLLSPLASTLRGSGGALLPIFGNTPESHEPLSSRIFIPSNLRRRHPGPVAVTIDETVLPWGKIEILLGNERVIFQEQLVAISQELGAMIGFDQATIQSYAA